MVIHKCIHFRSSPNISTHAFPAPHVAPIMSLFLVTNPPNKTVGLANYCVKQNNVSTLSFNVHLA
jgi:hypothetical protein